MCSQLPLHEQQSRLERSAAFHNSAGFRRLRRMAVFACTSAAGLVVVWWRWRFDEEGSDSRGRGHIAKASHKAGEGRIALADVPPEIAGTTRGASVVASQTSPANDIASAAAVSRHVNSLKTRACWASGGGPRLQMRWKHGSTCGSSK